MITYTPGKRVCLNNLLATFCKPGTNRTRLPQSDQ